MDIIVQILIKSILTIIMIVIIIFIWTNDIDVMKTIVRPVTSVVTFRKNYKIVINIANTTAARVVIKGNRNSGNIAMLFYDLKIVNSLEQNATLKDVILRYSLNGRQVDTESYVLLTGDVWAPQYKKNVDSIIIRMGADNNMVMMEWKNLRMEMGENKVLPPGGVLAASAAFILDFSDADDLEKLKNLAMVVIDYAGNETIKEIPVEKIWSEQAKHQVVENKQFVIDAAGKVTYYSE